MISKCWQKDVEDLHCTVTTKIKLVIDQPLMSVYIQQMYDSNNEKHIYILYNKSNKLNNKKKNNNFR